MAQVIKSVLVGHSAARMFTLVDQIEQYPEFLPWCGGTDVKWRDEQTTLATIRIDYLGIKQAFTTNNSKEIPHLINLKLQDGPFSHLEGCWRFIELNDEACKVEFNLHYEFSNKILEKVVGPVFSHIANSFIEAFVQRADKVYGSL